MPILDLLAKPADRAPSPAKPSAGPAPPADAQSPDPADGGSSSKRGERTAGGTRGPRPEQGAETGSGAKSQKQMTKAERRELQEKQRAAKTVAKGPAGAPGAPGAAGGSVKGKGKERETGTASPISQRRPPGETSGRVPGRTGSEGVGRVIGREVGGDSGKTAGGGDESREIRGSRIFQHFGLPKAPGQVKVDIHPAIIRLGLLFSEFKICGANARCLATLTTFKTVIQDYSTPANTTLSRHLMTHISPQITHLVSARAMSTSMGNAIRQLKLEISESNIDLPEQDAKDALCSKIDDYIRDRIIYADEVIQELAVNKIKDGDVILTYARSSVVEKVLLSAHEEGKRFSVIVVDSRPLLEGKQLLRKLTSVDPPIPCTYTLLPALPSVINEVNIVFVGAHSLCSNGAVYSRAGTAMVAMVAKAHNIPVLVCCETYKFNEGVILDSFGKNELAPGDLSLKTQFHTQSQAVPLPTPGPKLEIMNPLYDLTPPNCITVVVTEVGLIPPSSISSIPLALGRNNL